MRIGVCPLADQLAVCPSARVSNESSSKRLFASKIESISSPANWDFTVSMRVVVLQLLGVVSQIYSNIYNYTL